MSIEYSSTMGKNIYSGNAISKKAFKIGQAALTGMLYEISASPSPGLVSPYSTGSHTDMDYFTFLRSTAAIAPAMYLCAQAGMDFDDDILNRIRPLGIDAEREMFRATEGVNTQRGILFLGGLVCTAAGRSIRLGRKPDRWSVSEGCRRICEGIVERELKGIEEGDDLSKGEKLYLKLGVTGVRGEAEGGLPAVLNFGLPAYEAALSAGLDINSALVHTLVSLIARTADTTVLNRTGAEGLKFMNEMALEAIGLGGMMTEAGIKKIYEMDRVFKERNISPGGAADLLSIVATIIELENTVFEED